VETTQGALGADPCGGDRHQFRVGALQHPRTKREVELVVAVGVELVDDRQGENQPMLLGAVGSHHSQPAGRGADLATGQLNPAGDLGVGCHRPGDLEQGPSLLARGGPDGDLRGGV
jgi:hypothetical protein